MSTEAKDKAIDICIALWNELAKTGSKSKSDSLKNIGIGTPTKLCHDCPLCDFVFRVSGAEPGLDYDGSTSGNCTIYCPIVEKFHKSCALIGYYRWMNCRTTHERKLSARAFAKKMEQLKEK